MLLTLSSVLYLATGLAKWRLWGHLPRDRRRGGGRSEHGDLGSAVVLIVVGSAAGGGTLRGLSSIWLVLGVFAGLTE